MKPLVLLLALVVVPSARSQPSLDAADRVRLAEAFRLAESIGDSVWPGWSEAPFAVLLVTPDFEFLVRHPNPSNDFRLVTSYDTLLQSPVYVRPQQLPTHFLAAFPAVGGLSTVVVGRPDATGRSSTFWVLSLLHEHFHQLQTARPGYYEEVNALDLSGGDASGMWMLNYPYPYDDPDVKSAFQAYGRALLASLDHPDLDTLAAARARVRAVTSDPDARYAAFQIWQEGVARYTEYTVARAVRGSPLEAFAALPDFVPYVDAADSVLSGIRRGLSDLDVSTRRREAFYALGAAEGLLLDAVRPGWRGRYLGQPFRLEEVDGTR